ncbi:MAG: FG-GAP repeat domain-containing protein [Planctomycetota bacterium]
MDLDGDGDLDLICALDGRPAVSVVPNDGDGALGSPREYLLPPTTGGSSGLVVRDLDLDGHPDIAAAIPYGNTIQVLANRGDGSFSDPASFPAGTRPYGLAVGRFDGDPYPNLATVASEEKKAALLCGRGAGAFSTPQRFEAGDSPWKIVAADFDQDGLDDIAVAVGPERLFVLLSTGDGSFKPPVITALIAPLCAIQPADVDGDAAPDLIVSHWDSTDFSISLGNRDGTFRVSTRISIPGNFCEMNISDLDGHGLFDILGAGDTGLAILLGAGDGTFRPPSFVASRFYSGTRLAVGDLTGDRVPDAVFPHPDCCIAVMPGLAGGSLKSLKTIPLYGYSQALAAADFDGDGKSDLAVHAGWPERTTQVFFSKGSQEFEPPVALPMSQSCSRLAAGDATGDGILDIIAAGEQHIQVVPAKAPRGFAAPVHRNLPSTFSSFAIADFDDDGFADAAVSLIGENRILFYRSLGDGSFAPEESIPLSYAPSLQCAADCDRDGILDLVVNDKGRAAILPGWGDGTFDPARERSLAGHSLGPIAVADLDRDGWLDVVGATPDDILVFRGLPGGRFEEPVAWAAPEGTRLLIADLDGDENLDVAVYSARRGGFSVLRGERRGRLLNAESFFTGGILYHTFAAGDFDGNGTVDICGLVPGGETLPSWLAIAFNATPIPSSRGRNGNGVPDECDIRSGSSPDLDGDGVPDETEPDCNRNGRPDDYDIASGAGSDQDEDGVLDECDIAEGSSQDVDGNGIPDEAEADCDRSGVPDPYEIQSGVVQDLNRNGVPDPCDIASGASKDVDADGIPDEAQPDCDRDGVPDAYAIATGTARDCNRNGIPDPCDVRGAPMPFVTAEDLPVGDWISRVAVADLDRNGLQDLAAVRTKDRVSELKVFLGAPGR